MSTGHDAARGRQARAGVIGCAAFALATAALAACGTSGAAGGTNGSQDTPWRAVTACIRANGMPNWPDPTAGPDGQLGFPPDAPRTTDRVQHACAGQFAALSVPDTATAAPTSSRDLALLVRYAQCLRMHGFPTWPDPGPDGRFPYAAISALPDVKQAISRPPSDCQSFVPQGGIHVST
jgi:hypothetical protein